MSKKICLSFFIFGFLFLFVKPTFASSFYIAPSKTNVSQGSNFSIQLRLDTQGEQINAVEAFLSYPQNLLDVTYIAQGPQFGTTADKNFGGGGIHLSFATLNPNTGQLTVAQGNVLVATIGFRAKTTGTASIGIGSNSVALRQSNSSNTITGLTGGTITISPAPPRSASSLAAPILSNLRTTDIATNGATINWTTNKKSDSTVEFGFEKDHYFSSLLKSDLVNDHSIIIQNDGLLPGTNIHFKVISKDIDGNATTSSDQVFHLKGYKLRITLTDNEGKPVKGIKITLYSSPISNKTDESGQAIFEDMSSGTHIALLQLGTSQISREIEVQPEKDFTQVQDIKITVDNSLLSNFANKLPINLNLALKILIGIAAIFVIAILTGGIFYIKRRNEAVYSLFGQKNSKKDESDSKVENMFSPPDQKSSEPIVYTSEDNKKD